MPAADPTVAAQRVAVVAPKLRADPMAVVRPVPLGPPKVGGRLRWRLPRAAGGTPVVQGALS